MWLTECAYDPPHGWELCMSIVTKEDSNCIHATGFMSPLLIFLLSAGLALAPQIQIHFENS